MSNKLEQITQQLYEQGIEKAKIDSLAIIKDAEEHASELIANAQNEAQFIIDQAHKSADSYRIEIEAALHTTAQSMLEQVKQSISESVVFSVAISEVEQLMKSKEFIRNLIINILEVQVKHQENVSKYKIELANIFDEKSVEELRLSISDILQSDVGIRSDSTLLTGFVLINEDQKFKITFSQESLITLLKQSLDKKVYDILFKK